MSEHEVQQDEVEQEETYDYVPGGRRRKGSGLKGCLAVLIALVILISIQDIQRLITGG